MIFGGGGRNIGKLHANQNIGISPNFGKINFEILEDTRKGVYSNLNSNEHAGGIGQW